MAGHGATLTLPGHSNLHYSMGRIEQPFGNQLIGGGTNGSGKSSGKNNGLNGSHVEIWG